MPKTASPGRSGLVVKSVVGIVGLLLVLAGFAAWQMKRTVFQKPGEQALNRFAPSQTWAAMSLDARPTSLAQVRVLGRWVQALQNEHIEDLMERMMREADKDISASKWRKTFTGSGAVVMWPKGEDNLKEMPNIVAALQVNSAKETRALLQEEGKAQGGEADVYMVPLSKTEGDTKVFATIQDDYLLVASSPEAIRTAREVAGGKTGSLTAQPDYKALRAKVPSEANFLMYASPKLYKAAQEIAKQQGSVSEKQQQEAEAFAKLSAQGVCAGVTVGNDGLLFDSSVKVPESFGNAMGQVAPINAKAKNLPANPVAVLSISQPGVYLTVFQNVLKTMGGDTQKQWDKGVAQMEKETGLSLERDVIPALSGQWTVGVYADSEKRTVHLAALADDSHDAKPGALFAKVLTIADEQNRKNGVKEDTLAQETRDNVTYYKAKLGWDGKLPPAGKSGTETFSGKESEVLAGNKTSSTTSAPILARAGDNLLFATSPALLEESVQAVNGNKPLSDLALAQPDSSVVFVAYPERMMQMARPYLDEAKRNAVSEKPTALTVDDFMGIFGTAPIVAYGNVSEGYSSSHYLMPLNYEKLIHIGAVAAREAYDTRKENEKTDDSKTE